MQFLKPFILLLLLSWGVMLFGQNKCFYCKQELTGSYVQAEGKNFHPEHFFCNGCSKVISGSYSVKDGRFYHPECLAKKSALYCSHCGKELAGEYLVSDDKKYHESCYTEFVQAKCDICKKPLSGTYEVDDYGNTYHSSHRGETEPCDACRRLISPSLTGGGKKYQDGRAVCNICFPAAVTDDGIINSLMIKVLRVLKNSGITIKTEALSIKGADRNTLKQKSGGIYSPSMRGFCDTKIATQYKNGKKEKETATHTIYVLNGVPSIYIEMTIAHELMHVWFYQNTSKKHNAQILEGSCNYTAWLYLKAEAGKDLARLQKNLLNDPDPVYGDGFRKIHSMFSGKSVSEFLSYLKK